MRSSSTNSRHATPPPRTIQELAEQRRSASARSRPFKEFVDPSVIPEAASRTSSRPPSPAPRIISSRGSSPSRDQHQDLVRRTYFGYESNYPNDADVQRRERTQQFRPPKLVEKPLDPKFTNYRGHSKCRYCSILVPWQGLDAHQSECALAPVRCPLVDSETSTPCSVVCRGRELLQEHLQKCGARTRRCENRGCGKLVSVQSTAHHLQHCSFERIRCVNCHGMVLRNEESSHDALCPQALVTCPLGCGESLRRGDLMAHMNNTLSVHKHLLVADPKARAPEDPQSVIAFLLNRLLEVYESSKGRRSGQVSAQASRSATPIGHLPAPQSSYVNRVHAVVDDHPSSILHPGDDDLSDGDHPADASSLRHAINSAATIRPSDAGNLSSSSGNNNNNSTHNDLLVHPLVRAFRERPKIDRPLQSVGSSQLHLHVVTELLWYRGELAQLVNALSSGAGEAPSGPSRYTSLNAQSLQCLLSDITAGLEALHLQVDTLCARSDFVEVQQNSALGAHEDVLQLWRGVELLWYEGKLALYERMYQE